VVVAESVGLAVEVDDYGPMQEPVEHGGGHSGVTEDVAPGSDATIGRHHDRGLQIALGHNLKQSRSSLSRQWQISKLINHQERRAGVEPHGGGPATLDRGAVAAGSQVGGGGEVGAISGMCCSPCQSDRQVSLASPRAAR